MKRVFVGGLGRSGTTIVLNALYRHPMVYALPVETKFLVEEDGFSDLIEALTSRFSIAGASVAVKRFENLMRRQVTGLDESKFRLQHAFPNLEIEQYDTALDDFVTLIHRRRYFARRPVLLDATRRFIGATFDAEAAKLERWTWAEKTPSNIWRVPFLRELWPDCYIVHPLRDPRAILLSLMRRRWLPPDIIPALTMFEGYVAALLNVRDEQASNPHYHEIRLEHLVADPPGTLKILAEALDLVPLDTDAIDAVRDSMNAYYSALEPAALRITQRDCDLINEVLLPAVVELGYSPRWEP